MICNIPESTRIEVKFIASPVHYHSLLAWLRLHQAGFITSYPGRLVNNIYFDTCDLSAFAENLSGISSRTKVRYRWYGNSIFPDAGALEVKKKRNTHGWKLLFKIKKPPYKTGANWQTIRQLLMEQLPAEERRWMNTNPVPVIINRYYRKYLISRDQKIRVTVDTKQSVWEQRFKSYPNFIHRANIPDIVVVEFKFDKRHFDTASRIIQGIPVRQSRHSKYVTGVRAISGK